MPRKEEVISKTGNIFSLLFNSVPGSIIVGALLISFSILLSGGVIKIKGLDIQKTSITNQAAQAPTQQAPQAAVPQAPSGPVKVSVADEPVLGNKSAPITLVEFVDYECPFCKRFFDQTFPDIKKTYIDTGKVKLVMRNFPLSFHQNAHKESQAALCARDQGGDGVYFKYHDEIFKRTTSNGTGLALDQLPKIANDLGLDGNKLQGCLDSEKYKTKVDQDITEGTTAGVSGTPAFFVGKSTSGNEINGEIVVGAQPYSAFQTIIDQKLK